MSCRRCLLGGRLTAQPPASSLPLQATNIKFHDGMVPRDTKEGILRQKGVVLWFTGGRQAAARGAGWLGGVGGGGVPG